MENREIKFRVWNKEIKIWEDNYCITKDGSVLLSPSCYDPVITKTNDVVLMQYTGLKDKNEREIYEGDILTDHSKRPTSMREVNGEVIFFEDYGGYAVAIYSDDYRERYIYELRSIVAKEYEIVGNIYENPELLPKLDPELSSKLGDN